MTHQIKLEELQEWMEEEKLFLYASSSKEQKRLYANVAKSGFEVHHKGEVVWRGTQPFSAVEKYNEI